MTSKVNFDKIKQCVNIHIFVKVCIVIYLILWLCFFVYTSDKLYGTQIFNTNLYSSLYGLISTINIVKYAYVCLVKNTKPDMFDFLFTLACSFIFVAIGSIYFDTVIKKSNGVLNVKNNILVFNISINMLPSFLFSLIVIILSINALIIDLRTRVTNYLKCSIFCSNKNIPEGTNNPISTEIKHLDESFQI